MTKRQKTVVMAVAAVVMAMCLIVPYYWLWAIGDFLHAGVLLIPIFGVAVVAGTAVWLLKKPKGTE